MGLNQGTAEQTAGRMIDTLTLGGATSAAIAVASTGTAYGLSFPVFRGCSFSFHIQLGGTGTKSVKVELEQGLVRPTAEQSADTTNYVVPDNKAPVFANIADTNLHKAAYSPIADGFCRLKFTGLGSNDASTTVTVAKCFVIKNA